MIRFTPLFLKQLGLLGVCDAPCVFPLSLEVSLEKEREGEWVSLLSGEGEASGVPQLRGPVEEQLSSEELRDLRRGVAEATNDVIIILSMVAMVLYYRAVD